MKKTLKSILCFALTVAMLVVTFNVAIQAETPTVKNYYVRNGGTGDGRTEDNPAATVAKAVESVNSDNLSVGDTANIYIMQRTDWAACDSNSAHNMTYWAEVVNNVWHCITPEHTAQIIIQPYSSEGTTYLAYSKYLGDAWGLCINGPTTFKGLTLVLTKGTTNARIDANGNNLTLEDDVVFARYDGNSKLTSWDGSNIVTNDRPIITSGINLGTNTADEDVNITLKNVYKPSGDYYGAPYYAFYVSNSNYTSFTYQKNLNLNFTNSESKPKIVLGDNKASGTTTINGSLNINAKDTAALTLVAGNGSFNTNAIQIITGENTTYSGDVSTFNNVTASSAWYIKDTTEDGVFSLTDTAGTYKISEGAKVTATNSEGENFYPINNTLTLPAGEYTIKNATFKNYYVKNGGTGDGRTEDNPAATVAKAIESINADNLGTGDIGIIYIMQRTDWAACDENSAHNMTYWADENGGNYSWHCKAPKHTAQIVVQPYSSEGTTYLAYSKYLGDAWGLCINGPTTFKGLTLVLPKGTTNARIDANGNNLTFENDVVFARYDGNSKLTSWDGSNIVTNDRPIITSGVNENGEHNIAEDVNITLNNVYKPSGDFYGAPYYAFYVSNSNYTSFTYQKNLNLNFTNSESKPKVVLGDNKANGTTTINGSLNINAKNTAALTLVAGNGSFSANAIQIITGANTTYSGDISTFANVNTNKIWNITDANEGTISFSDIAGTFIVTSNYKYAYAYDALNNPTTVYYGENTLTLPEGDYTIGYTNDLNDINITMDMEGFLEWQNNNDGTLTAVIISPDQPLETYKNYINYRTDLKNTYNKLTSGDKNLNVVYFGGSVTVGTGSSDREKYSWRALIGQWLKTNFPQANINNINTGAGESGTYLGSFRVERDVISQKPDLFFLEYSINDKYANASYETAQLQYETIVRKVREALPECDIVTILVTDQGEAAAARADQGGILHTQAQAHEDMAKIYNIPTICVGKALADALPSASFTTDDWRVYVADSVHPNDNGYKLYYNVIREFMYNNLIYNEYDTTIANHTMPELQSEKLLDGNITAIEITQEVFDRSVALGGQGFIREAGATAINDTYHGGVYAPKANTDAEFILEFTGTELAAFVNCYSPTQYMVKIDNGNYITRTFAGHNPTIIAEGLISGKHTVYLKPIMSTLPSNTGAVWINMFFTRDAAYQTCKTYSNYGDINLDGKINVLDLVKANEKLTDTNLCHPADINKDGKVDLTDVKLMKQYLIGKYQIV